MPLSLIHPLFTPNPEFSKRALGVLESYRRYLQKTAERSWLSFVIILLNAKEKEGQVFH